MSAQQPIDELGATTRRTLIVNYLDGRPQASFPISEGDTQPPCSLDGVKSLSFKIEKFRRGESEPYEVSYRLEPTVSLDCGEDDDGEPCCEESETE